jgi:hypothetical protein
VDYENDYDRGTGCAQPSQTGSGPDRVYVIDVPARQELAVTVTPAAQFDVMVNLVASSAGCVRTGGSCLAGRDLGQPGQPERVTWTNSSGATQTVFVVIDGYNPQSAGTYELLATLAEPPATLNPGDTCQTAPALPFGTTVVGSTVNLVNSYGPGTGCVSTSGPDGAYAVEVEAGRRLRVTVTPTSGWNPSVNLVAGPASACDAMPRTCLASRDASQTGAETLTWINDGSETRSVFVIVDTSATNGTGSFTIQAVVDTPPADDLCAGATPLTSGQVTTGTTVGYSGDYGTGSGCQGTAGPDRVYSIDVAPGATLSATVTPTGTSWNVSLNLMLGPASSCGIRPRTCVAGSDQSGAGQPEAVTYRNPTQETQTVFLVIESPSTTGSGTFSLVATVTN